MAALVEIYTRLNDSSLRNRVAAACLIEAKVIVMEDPATANHAERLAWAGRVFSGGPALHATAQQVMAALIVLNPDADYAADATITAGVGQVVTKLALMPA